MTQAPPELRDATPEEQPRRFATEVVPSIEPEQQPPITEAEIAEQTGLTKEQRTERAKLAASARWAKRFDWETCNMKDGMDRLAELRADADKGTLILKRRQDAETVKFVKCVNPDCNTQIDVGRGAFAGMMSPRDPATGLVSSYYACSAGCFLYMTRHIKHAQSNRG